MEDIVNLVWFLIKLVFWLTVLPAFPAFAVAAVYNIGEWMGSKY